MKNIIVTGGLGFIGSNFINYISKIYPTIEKIINLDKIDYCSSHDNILTDQNYKFIEFDISKQDILNILFENNIDTIFHFAAETHVDKSYENPIPFINTNIIGTFLLLEAVRKYNKLDIFFHISTDEVYGDRKTFFENDYLEPTNPYSASKASAEMFINCYSHSYGIRYKMIRMNNVYGPNQYIDKLIPKTIFNFLNGKKMSVHGQGLVNRTFIYIEDAIRAILTIYEKGSVNEVYNIGSINKITVIDMITKIFKILNIQDNIDNYLIYTKDRPYNDLNYDINCDKLINIGWYENILLDDGLTYTVNFIKKRYFDK